MTIRLLGRYWQIHPVPLEVGSFYVMPPEESAWRMEVNGKAMVCPVVDWRAE